MLKHFIGVASLAAAACFAFFPTAEGTPPPPPAAPKLQPADVHVMRPTTQRVVVTGHGQVQARWQSNLSAEVGGRVTRISDKLLVGASFKAGDVLVRLDDTSYRSAVSAARADLARAERALLEEMQRAKLAEDNWKASGLTGQASALTLRKPQLDEARTAVDAARAALEQADRNLRHTDITAPFDGVVVQRFVNPGEILQSGARVAQVFDTSLYEITIPLSATDLESLDGPIGRAARAADAQGNSWRGQVVRVAPQVDPQNRWISVIVELTEASQIRPGQFLTVEIEGQQLDAVYAIPEELLSPQGDIWLLDDENRLVPHQVQPLFSSSGQHYIAPPPAFAQDLRIAIPNSGFLSGAVVAPRLVAQPDPDPNLRASNLIAGDTE